jgi:hypothetical protein
MSILGQVVDDLTRDGVSISLARANDKVKTSLAKSFSQAVREIPIFDNVDAGVNAAANSASGRREAEAS